MATFSEVCHNRLDFPAGVRLFHCDSPLRVGRFLGVRQGDFHSHFSASGKICSGLSFASRLTGSAGHAPRQRRLVAKIPECRGWRTDTLITADDSINPVLRDCDDNIRRFARAISVADGAELQAPPRPRCRSFSNRPAPTFKEGILEGRLERVSPDIRDSQGKRVVARRGAAANELAIHERGVALIKRLANWKRRESRRPMQWSQKATRPKTFALRSGGSVLLHVKLFGVESRKRGGFPSAETVVAREVKRMEVVMGTLRCQ